MPAPISLDRVNSLMAREAYQALIELGGQADLMTLCLKIEARQRVPLKENWRKSLLSAIERHSSDSPEFEGDPADPHADLFRHVSPLIWGVRHPVQAR